MMPEWDLLVILSPAWSESTKQLICTAFPLGLGAFGGVSSLASGYNEDIDFHLFCASLGAQWW